MDTHLCPLNLPPHPHLLQIIYNQSHILQLIWTGSIQKCPLFSHYLVCRKNNSYFVGIKYPLDKDLI